jgi:hypothetical protein
LAQIYEKYIIAFSLEHVKIVLHDPNNVTMWDKLLLLPNQKKSFCSTASALMEGFVCWALSEAQTEF